MERSNRYDWFKGQNDKPQDPRAKAKRVGKITWRVVRIVAIVFVLFVTLWGCGQSFTLQTDSTAQRAIEFYQAEGDIAPHVSSFQQKNTPVEVKTKDVSNNDVTTSYDIFSIYPQSSNIWLPKETDGYQAISDFQKEISTQNENKNLKPSSVFGGVNETIRITDANKNLLDNKPISYKDGRALAFSSAATETTWGQNKTAVNSIIDGLITSNKLALLTSTVSATNVTTLIQPYKWWAEKPNNLLTQITTGNNFTSNEVARSKFRDELFDYFNNLGKPNWLVNSLTLQGDYEIPAGITLSVLDATGLSKKYQEVLIAQDNARQVLNYLGYNFSGTTNAPTISAPEAGHMPGLYGNKYIPIVTWGDAWERGFGPFNGLVGYPVAQLQIAILKAFPFMNGWEALISLIILVVVLKLVTLLISFNSIIQQAKMEELRMKKAAIEAKYEGFKGNKQMERRKKQEIAEMFKKNGIKTSAQISGTIYTLPLLFATWRIISAITHFKVVSWLGINFSATSWRELFAGNVIYLPLMVVALGTSVLSGFLPRILSAKRDKLRSNAQLKAALKKNERTQVILQVVFAVFSLIFNAGVQIYSIITAIFGVAQAFFTHYYILNHRHRAKAKAALR